jgi:hypothetical protein
LPSAADPGALPDVLLQAVNDAAIEIPSSNIPILFVSLMVPPPIFNIFILLKNFPNPKFMNFIAAF